MLISNLSIENVLRERIHQAQMSDVELQANEGLSDFVRAPNEVLLFGNGCVYPMILC